MSSPVHPVSRQRRIESSLNRWTVAPPRDSTSATSRRNAASEPVTGPGAMAVRSAWSSTASTGAGRCGWIDSAMPAMSPSLASRARPATLSAPWPVTPSHPASARTASTTRSRVRGTRRGRCHRTAAARLSPVGATPDGVPASRSSTPRRSDRMGGHWTSAPSALTTDEASVREPTRCGALVVVSQDCASRAQRSPPGSVCHTSYSAVGTQCGSTSPSSATRSAMRASSTRYAVCSGAVSSLAVAALRSRTARPPVRRTRGGDCDHASSSSSRSASTSDAAAPAAASTASTLRSGPVTGGGASAVVAVHPAIAQDHRHLARERDLVGRHGAHQALLEEPARAVVNRSRATRRVLGGDDPHRRTPREAVEDRAGAGRGVGHRRADGGLVEGVAPGEVVPARSETGDAVAENVLGGARHDRALGSPPHEGEAPEVVEQVCGVRRVDATQQTGELGAGEGVADDRRGLERLQVRRVEAVDGTQRAGARRAAGRERREVARRRSGEVGSGREQGGELLVGAAPDVVGQRAARGGGSMRHCTTVVPLRPA